MASWIIGIVLAILPVFFLPVTQEYYDTNKWTLLVLIAVFTLAVWFYRSLRARKITLLVSPASLGLGFLAVSSLVSLLIASPNKIEAMLTPFGPVTWIALALLTAIIPTLMNANMQNRLRGFLLGTTSLIGLIAIYQFFGLGKTMVPAVTYLSDPLWTPTGSTIASLTLFVIVGPLIASRIFDAWKRNNEQSVAIYVVMSLAITLAIGLTAWQLVPKIASSVLPQQEGWRMTVEAFKNPKQALVGVGAENFLAAFSAGRSATLNLTPLWSVRFMTSSNTFFHLLTIYGLLGGAAFLMFAKSLVRRDLILGLLVLLVTLPNLSILIVIVIILLTQDHEKFYTRPIPQNLITQIVILVISSAFIGTVLFFLGRAYAAEFIFYQSIKASTRQNGTETYTLQMRAVQWNPYLSRMHIIFSQTNLVLAAALANTLASDNNAHDRDLMTQLVQQSIQEGKVAAKLNTSNVLAWENLARVYEQLIDVAQGSDAWAISSFQQAIALDPTNPSLRVELGSVYVRIKKYSDAITQFQRAAALKSNYTNAYYNLANAYKLNNDSTQAIAIMEKTLSLLDTSSSDYRVVEEELKTLKTPPSSGTPTQK